MSPVKRHFSRTLTIFLVLTLLISVLPGLARAEDAAEQERPAIDFLSYEEAVTYFDFDRAASNWCNKFGMNPYTQLAEAKQAILAGTDPNLIIGLATFARDTGHGGEKLLVTTAFRPASYQETLGLHDANINTGPYRNAMKWNGRKVTDFWWKAEQAEGWPDKYAIDLSDYDISALDLRIFYRAALRLWDNGWVNGYYAKPGFSSHNSGTAMDISNYWIATNFATAYDYNGRTYRMEDYGIYKPLQPSGTSAGETWHITSAPNMQALGNYDNAFDAGFEVVYGMYFNPGLRGWNMDGGWSIYLGAGVTVLQLRLCQLGLLEPRYVTGYYCSKTEAAVRAFQQKHDLDPDGICGVGTMKKLMKMDAPAADKTAPALTDSRIIRVTGSGLTVHVSAADNSRLNAFRVETRGLEEEYWVTRYYNAPAGGEGDLDVDIWKEGEYVVRVTALDAAGNESASTSPDMVFVDATPPALERLTVSDITDEGFTLRVRASDNGTLTLLRALLTDRDGTVREMGFDAAGQCVVTGLTEGVWTVAVEAEDACGNRAAYTFRWQYEAGQARPGMIQCVRIFPFCRRAHRRKEDIA